MLPVSYRLSHTRLAFFLRETRPPPPTVTNGSLQRSEPFVVFQTKELPVLNVSLGPFSTSQAVARELLQPSSTLDIPERLTVNWKVRAFIVRTRVPASQPVAQVLFYVAGRDWDDFGVTERLPCVRLHAFRDAREVKSSCRLSGGLATCLVRAELPLAWFGPPAPAARRKSQDGLEAETAGESQQAELYYTLHAPDAAGGCGGARRGAGPGTGARAESPTQHPLLRIGSISLFRPPPKRALQEHRLDSNLMIRLPDRPLKPGEVLSILLYLAPNSSAPSSPSLEHFTLRYGVRGWGAGIPSELKRIPDALQGLVPRPDPSSSVYHLTDRRRTPGSLEPPCWHPSNGNNIAAPTSISHRSLNREASPQSRVMSHSGNPWSEPCWVIYRKGSTQMPHPLPKQYV